MQPDMLALATQYPANRYRPLIAWGLGTSYGDLIHDQRGDEGMQANVEMTVEAFLKAFYARTKAISAAVR